MDCDDDEERFDDSDVAVILATLFGYFAAVSLTFDSFRRLVCCPSGTFTPTLLLTEALRLCTPGLLSVRAASRRSITSSLAFMSVSLSSELLPSPINSMVGLGLINQCLRR